MDEPDEEKRNPIYYILALILIFLMVLGIFPYYLIKSDPEPKVPSFDYVLKDGLIPRLDTSNKIESYEDIRRFITPGDPLVKTIATKIAAYGCGDELICQAKAIFYFVRDNFIYVSESDDFFQTFDQAMASRGGDCDDATILLANMYRAIGIPVNIIFIRKHVFLEIYVPEAPRKYLNKEGWIFVDGTCRSCRFGETIDKDLERYYVRIP